MQSSEMSVSQLANVLYQLGTMLHQLHHVLFAGNSRETEGAVTSKRLRDKVKGRQ